MQLDEVRRQSGGKASLPAVPEEEDEDLSQDAADAAQQQLPVPSKLSYSQSEAAQSAATQQQQHSQQSGPAHGRILDEEQAENMQMLQPTASCLYGRADMLNQPDDFDLMPQQQNDVTSQEPSTQRQTGPEMRSMRQEEQKCTQQPSCQQPSKQHPIRQPPSPMSQAGLTFQIADGARSPPVQQKTIVSPPRPAANRPAPSRAGTKAPAMQTSPVMAHAVEHSSLSLAELAGVSRSKLRPPSTLNSPPKRASRVMLSKQATNSHLVKLAAAVPLPASPDGAGKLALEPTAAAALATAVAKPSHIPAPAVKASRLKKPTNTSGFFSSGRSFTGGASNSR